MGTIKKKFHRTDRIAELLQRILAPMIQQEIQGLEHNNLITISCVKVSSDLRHANIYFTALSDDPEKTLTLLNSLTGFLRGALAKSKTLRVVPKLHFVYDESIQYANRLNRLIDESQ